MEADHDPLLGTPVGERIRQAREERGVSLDEVARQTRIPIRHLEHIERGDWDALPAITYSVGFVRAYANAVGLDGPALAAELREQLGGAARNVGAVPAGYYEPADPARVPPRSLALLAALIAILLVGAYLVWRHNAVGDAGDVAAPVAEAPAQQKAPPPAAPAAQASAGGQVVLSATEPVWLRVYEAGGAKLYEGTLKPGDHYQVPATASAPELLTGRPNVLQVMVGSTAIPTLGPPEHRVKDVSLKPADLLARIGTGAAPATATPPPAAAPRPHRSAAASLAAPVANQAAPAAAAATASPPPAAPATPPPAAGGPTQ